LKADIAERCRLLNKKKAALDAKTKTSAYSRRLHLLEKELEDLKAKAQRPSSASRKRRTSLPAPNEKQRT
jgi:hypothetical protein